MDLFDRKDKKVVNLNSYQSAIRVGVRDNQSVSTSRGKKYFKMNDKPKTPRNEMIGFFMKKSRNQIVPNGNDYGLDAQVNQRVLESQKNNYMRSSKVIAKNEQSSQKSQIKLLKSSGGKKYRKNSQKTRSLQSLIRIQTCATPKKQSLMRKIDRSIQPPSPQMTMDTKNYEKTIKFLERQNQYYEGLYINSQQRIEALKQQAENERKKYQRVRKIYQEKITQISQNKESCQKNLGHIYTYDSPLTDIVPDDVIVQNSLECSIDELHRTSRKNSDLASSKLSTLSVNSR